MKRRRLIGLAVSSAAALGLIGFFAARSDAADDASRYPYDPVCPWGRISDGRGMIVRCIRKDEKNLLLAGTANPGPSASAVASASSSATGPDLPPEEIAKTLKVEVVSVTPDQGKLAGAEKKLALGRDKFLSCVAKNGGLEKDEAEVHVRFLVSDRGRAEGVSVAKRSGVGEKAAHCVADVVDRRAVGTPETSMLGATAVVKFSRVKPK